MSNLIKTQKIHRERQQIAARAHLGPLEKKKDYVKRARGQEKQKKELKELHQKAISKNPDEFHFHMLNSETKNGVHLEKVEDEEISITNVNADYTYIAHRRSMESKKIEKLKAKLHLLGVRSDVPQNKHTLFVDTEKEAQKADVAKLLDTHHSLINRPFNRLRTQQLAKLKIKEQNSESLKQISHVKNKAYKELAKRIEREKKLRILLEKLEIRKQLMDTKNKAKIMPRLVQEETNSLAPVYKWPQQRQK